MKKSLNFVGIRQIYENKSLKIVLRSECRRIISASLYNITWNRFCFHPSES